MSTREFSDSIRLGTIKANLIKNDKEPKEFILEEKAKQFLNGSPVFEETSTHVDNFVQESPLEITKDIFDSAVATFIQKKGN